MEKLSMCRICLIKDVRLHCLVNTHLQEIYELLSGNLLETKDMRPLHACYMCYARLRKCLRLRTACLHSEDMLSQLLENDLCEVTPSQDMNMLQRVPVLHMNVDPVVHRELNIHPSPATNDQVIEDWVEVTQDNTIDQGICSQFIKEEIKSEVVEISSEDEELDSIQSIKVETGSASDNSCVGDGTQESSISKSNRNISSVDLQNKCDQPVKIVSHQMDFSSFSNSATVTMYFNPTDLENASQFNNLSYRENVEMLKANICEEHKQIVHTSSATHCSENGDSFKHMPRRTREKSFRCPTCDKCFRRNSYLKKHVKNKHACEKPYKCDTCGKSFSIMKSLSRHILIHSDEKPYKCDTCGKSFSIMKSLSRHILIHSDEKPYKCDTCKKGFLTNCDLTRHIRIHTGEKPYKCDTCGKYFREWGALSKHIFIHTSEKPHKCETCGKGFIRKFELSCHILTHTGEKTYKCDMCGKGFIRKSDLSLHIRTHTGEKPFKCETCGKSFIRKINLSLHIRTHTGEKPYKCETCGKGFIKKMYLSCHILTHTGEKLYKCDTCGKGFNRKIDLLFHIRRHTGEKPYKCDKCGKWFYRKYGLLCHIRKHSV